MWGLNPKQHPFKNSVKPLFHMFLSTQWVHAEPRVSRSGRSKRAWDSRAQLPWLSTPADFPPRPKSDQQWLGIPIREHYPSLNSVVWQGQIQIGSKLKSLCSGQRWRTHVLTQTWHPLHQWLTWTCRTWLGCESSQWTTLQYHTIIAQDPGSPWKILVAK